jgi:hypothetical protein
MILKEMEWKDAKDLIDRRLRSLQMCKMGSIATDVNDQMKALGPRPAFTEAEKMDIQRKMSTVISKAIKMSPSEVRRLHCEPRVIAEKIAQVVQKVTMGSSVHPDEKSWVSKKEILQEQKAAREAQLEGDFRDTMDSFLMGLKKIEDFPRVYDELESRSW